MLLDKIDKERELVLFIFFVFSQGERMIMEDAMALSL